ncbi:MAG TPA: PH domain-containing protein [Solirubrobacteraceae bacterium]|nr:PH domain-containing protein [Solirubrobacteraceae bacterium]
MQPLPEPTRRLPDAARWYWRTRGLLQGAAAIVAALAAAGELGDLWWLALLVAVAAAAALAGLVPELRWRRWRYEVRDDEIDLRHGTFVVRRTLIPIRRVQHVDTEAGVLRGAFGLARVTFHTAAGGVDIPALGRGEAENVRARVARLARSRDDA